MALICATAGKTKALKAEGTHQGYSGKHSTHFWYPAYFQKGLQEAYEQKQKSNAVSEEEMRMVETPLTPSAWLELEG